MTRLKTNERLRKGEKSAIGNAELDAFSKKYSPILSILSSRIICNARTGNDAEEPKIPGKTVRSALESQQSASLCPEMSGKILPNSP
jgi:hypothetical protein